MDAHPLKRTGAEDRFSALPTKDSSISVELPRKLKPDAQGVVRWTETLAPRTKVTWKVAYKLEYPTDFVARAKAADTRAPASTIDFDAEEMPAVSSPAARPAPRAKKLYEQIDQLENSL